mmetsp:Transcript_33929/g.89020  ORF Transcript_33929/g.89020 Transcript_33929/m.89020 type:complete len:416 (-) Transcript_33929:725-1972(-)
MTGAAAASIGIAAPAASTAAGTVVAAGARSGATAATASRRAASSSHAACHESSERDVSQRLTDTRRAMLSSICSVDPRMFFGSSFRIFTKSLSITVITSSEIVCGSIRTMPRYPRIFSASSGVTSEGAALSGSGSSGTWASAGNIDLPSEKIIVRRSVSNVMGVYSNSYVTVCDCKRWPRAVTLRTPRGSSVPASITHSSSTSWVSLASCSVPASRRFASVFFRGHRRTVLSVSRFIGRWWTAGSRSWSNSVRASTTKWVSGVTPKTLRPSLPRTKVDSSRRECTRATSASSTYSAVRSEHFKTPAIWSRIAPRTSGAISAAAPCTSSVSSCGAIGLLCASWLTAMQCSRGIIDGGGLCAWNSSARYGSPSVARPRLASTSYTPTTSTICAISGVSLVYILIITAGPCSFSSGKL